MFLTEKNIQFIIVNHSQYDQIPSFFLCLIPSMKFKGRTTAYIKKVHALFFLGCNYTFGLLRWSACEYNA